MTTQAELRDALQGAVKKVPALAPFMDSVSLVWDDQAGTAYVYKNTMAVCPKFWAELTPGQRIGLAAHELCHIVFCHATRRGQRDGKKWNIAADFAINNWLVSAGIELPPDALLEESFADLSAEDIYDLLPSGMGGSLNIEDLLTDDSQGSVWPDPGKHEALSGKDPHNQELKAATRSVQAARAEPPRGLWKQDVIDSFRMSVYGDLTGYDRRFIGDGLYIDDTRGTSKAAVCIDTSSSIQDNMLQRFLSILEAVMESYGIEVTLIYADSDIRAIHELQPGDDIPGPVGGGSTDFHPFFAWLAKHVGEYSSVYYYTDLQGEYPHSPPVGFNNVTWALWPGSPTPRWGDVVYVE